MDIEVPDRLVTAILFARGQADGEAWLRALPRRVDHYLRRWDLKPIEIANGGAMSCCLFCVTTGGEEAVLKIPFDAASGRLESRSLDRWAKAQASPRVLATAPSSGVFLMSRVRPGTTAVPTGQPSDSVHFSELITRMAWPGLGSMRGLQTLETVVRMRFEWAYERFLDPGYERELELMAGVERLLTALLDTSGPPSIIHGDLQFKNVLVGEGGDWQAIDPFTCRGDVNAEAALWIAVQGDGSTVEQRIAELAQCPLLAEGRLRAWTYVHCVAEYRSYMPEVAARTRDFAEKLDWQELVAALV